MSIPWNPHDEDTVKAEVKKYDEEGKTPKWTAIGQLLQPKRTNHQVRNRYIDHIKEGNLNKGTYTQEEDLALLNLYNGLLGHSDWNFISERMEGRSPGNVKNRFNSRRYQATYQHQIHKQQTTPANDSKTTTTTPTDLQLSTSAFKPSDTFYIAGDIVNVQRRTYSGSNKPGGIARITAKHGSGGDFMYDVKYIVGRAYEMNLSPSLLQTHVTPTSSKKREREKSTTSPGRIRDHQQNRANNTTMEARSVPGSPSSSIAEYDPNTPYFLNTNHPRGLIDFKGVDCFVEKTIKWNYWEESYHVIAKVTSGTSTSQSLILQPYSQTKGYTLIVSNEDFRNGTFNKQTLEQLPSRAEALVLNFARQEQEKMRLDIEENVKVQRRQKIENRRKLFDAKVEARLRQVSTTGGSSGEEDGEGDTRMSSVASNTTYSFAAELTTALCACTEEMDTLLSIVVAQSALNNGGTVTLSHPTTYHTMTCISEGFTWSGATAKADGMINDTNDSGEGPAFIFLDEQTGYRYRVLPCNIKPYVKEIYNMHVQQQSLRSAVRSSTSSSNNLSCVDVRTVDMNTLRHARDRGFMNLNALDQALYPAEAVAKHGVCAVVRRQVDSKRRQKKEIQTIVKRMVDKENSKVQEEKSLNLLVEKEAVKRLAEAAFHKFIYGKSDYYTSTFLNELVKNVKVIAPETWAVFSTLGHCERDDRNLK